MRKVDAIFNSMVGKGEPSPYIDCDYLESDGRGQYIDTGVVPNQDTRIVIRAGIKDTSSGIFLFGARTRNGVAQFNMRFTKKSDGMTNLGNYDSASVGIGVKNSLGTLAVFDCNANVWSKNGSSATFATTEFQTNCSIYLFGVHNNNVHDPSLLSSCIIGACQIYDSNGVLVRDYRPKIRREDGVTGFCDMINDTFNPSANGVNFLYGNF